MPYTTDAAGRSWLSPGIARGVVDNLDRILLGACAAIWLAALGAGVAATVALVDLGRGHATTSEASETPWLLYTVIGVSAVVIIGAVPLLLRARRTALAEPRPDGGTARARPGRPPTPVRGTEAPTEKLRVLGTVADQVNPRPGYPVPPVPARPLSAMPVAAVDQLWLRCALVIACAMGVAQVAIGVATYLMAVDTDGPAWFLYGLAGLITLAMPAIPWFYLRQLRDVLDTSARS